MRKEILSEIDRMRFLVGYSKGKVISEQNTIILEQKIEDGKPNFRALVSDLKNDFYPEWYYIPEKSNITSLTGDTNSFVAVRSNKLKRLTRGTIYLRASGDVFKDKEGEQSVIGKWYYKSTPTGERKFELKVDINEPDKTNSKDYGIEATNINGETTNEFIKTSPDNIKFNQEIKSLIIKNSEGVEVYSPIDAEVGRYDPQTKVLRLWGGTENIYIVDIESSLKEKDIVKKGQLLGKFNLNYGGISVDNKNGEKIDSRVIFNLK